MAGFNPQQQATLRAAIDTAMEHAGGQAAANLATWGSKQAEMLAFIQQAETQKNEMVQQMGVFRNDAEAMKAMLLKSKEDQDNLTKNLAEMQQSRDVVLADLSAKSEQVETILAQLKTAGSDAMVMVRQAYGGLQDEQVQKFAVVEQRLILAEQKINDLHNRTSRVEVMGSGGAQPGGGGGGNYGGRTEV